MPTYKKVPQYDSVASSPNTEYTAASNHRNSSPSLSSSRSISSEQDPALLASFGELEDAEGLQDAEGLDHHPECQPLVPSYTRYPPQQVQGTAIPIPRSNDGVFSNLAAKPDVNVEKVDEQPPSYEQAAADSTPPYWETTIIAPGMSSDEVYVEGLPVGNFFGFVWNMLISLSFQFIGFLLTYLLHTTHAAKNGSKAGLGITLVQYGYYMRAATDGTLPEDEPDAFNFSGNDEVVNTTIQNNNGNEWLSYLLMIAGWFILIRSLSEYLRARKMEQVVRQIPALPGVSLAVIAEGEGENAV